jgi:hypothetical protein
MLPSPLNWSTQSTGRLLVILSDRKTIFVEDVLAVKEDKVNISSTSYDDCSSTSGAGG